MKKISPLLLFLFLLVDTKFSFADPSLANPPKIESIQRNKGGGFLQQHQHMHRFNMYISHEKRFVWFRVYKVASGTIKDKLLEQVMDLRQRRIPQIPQGILKYFTFAIVRNPWDRVVSCYFDKIRTRKCQEFSPCFCKSFAFFVRYISKINLNYANDHIKLQSKLVPVNRCDFIGKLDHFNDDFKYICDQIGIDIGELGHKHHTDHKHYSQYYTPQTKQIIARIYREDIETFGFTFKDVKN